MNNEHLKETKMNNEHLLDPFDANDPGFDVEQLRQNTLFLRRKLSDCLAEADKFKDLYSRLLADYGHSALTPFGQNALEKAVAELAALRNQLDAVRKERDSMISELKNRPPGITHLKHLIRELTYDYHLNIARVVLEQAKEGSGESLAQAEK